MIKNDKGVVIGRGFFIDDPNRKRTDIVIPDSDRKGHFWCFGTTRVGKTRLMESMIVQDIRKGYSVVVIDPKGDIDLLSNIILTAIESNRTDDMVFISPIYPEYSAIIDPLSHYYMPEELVGHIVSGVETGKEPFFYNIAYEISLMVVQSLIAKEKYNISVLDNKDEQNNQKAQKRGFNLLDVKNIISHEDLSKLLEEVEMMSMDDNTGKLKQLFLDLKKIHESPQDYYSKVSSSLRVALTELTSGNIGKIVGKADSNRFITRLEHGKSVIMVAQLGSLLTRRAAFTLGKVIISMIASFVGRVFASGNVVSPPLALYIDEAQNVMYNGIDDLFAKAGGAGVWVHGFCQSVSQLYAEIGEDKSKTILDNTNTKIFMRVPDTDTSHYASNHFGTERVQSPILSATGGVNTREEKVDRVEYDEFITLKPRLFYGVSYQGRFKAKTLHTDKVLIPLPFEFKIKFPKVKTITTKTDESQNEEKAKEEKEKEEEKN